LSQAPLFIFTSGTIHFAHGCIFPVLCAEEFNTGQQVPHDHELHKVES